MAFKWIRGRTRIREFPRTASVTFTAGDLVIITSGAIATALNNTTTGIVGIVIEGVASTDGDYATSAVPIKVELPADSHCVLQGPVSNGSLLTTSVGVKFGLTSAGAVDFADNTDTILMCVNFNSASQGEFELEETARWNA